MQWIRTDYQLPFHAAVFRITRFTLAKFQDVLSVLTNYQDPEEIAACLKRIILEVRPELVGCVVYFIEFDVSGFCWKIGVSHCSLPVQEIGDMPDEIPLELPDRET